MVAQEEARLYTADLWEITARGPDDEEKRYELDEGELIEMSPGSDRHGVTMNWIAYLVAGFVLEHDLGEVTAAETGFVLGTDAKTGRDTVRAPDVAFIAKARLVPLTGKFFRLAPDLAVEVVSPSDTARQLRRKVRQFLKAGTRLMLILYPDDRIVDVYRPGQPAQTLDGGDQIDLGEVLPGFVVKVSDLFARLRE